MRKEMLRYICSQVVIYFWGYISRVDLKVLIYFRGYIFTGANIFQRIYQQVSGNILAGWAAASRSGDEACPGESQTGPGEHCIGGEDDEEKLFRPVDDGGELHVCGVTDDGGRGVCSGERWETGLLTRLLGSIWGGGGPSEPSCIDKKYFVER